jgi:hypothetical protein
MASVFTASEQDSFVIPGPVAGPTAGWIHSLETPTGDGYAQSFGSPADAAPSPQLGDADRFSSTQHTELPHAPRSAFNLTPTPRSVAATLPPYETTSFPVSPPLRNIQSARPLDYMTSHRFSQPPPQTGPLPPAPSHECTHSPVRSSSETGGPNVFPPPQENRFVSDDRLNGWFDQLSISPPPPPPPDVFAHRPPPGAASSRTTHRQTETQGPPGPGVLNCQVGGIELRAHRGVRPLSRVLAHSHRWYPSVEGLPARIGPPAGGPLATPGGQASGVARLDPRH